MVVARLWSTHAPGEGPPGRDEENQLGRQRVPLEKITWSQTPSITPEDLAPLAQSMQEKIQHRPLLNTNLECVDGARQLEVLKQWGVTEVDVIVTDDLEFSMKVIAQRHDTVDLPEGVCRHPVTQRRIARFHKMLSPQVTARMVRIRQESNLAQTKGITRKPSPQYRDVMAAALRLSNETVYTRTVNFFKEMRLAVDQDELDTFNDLVVRMEKGELTIYGADGRLTGWRRRRDEAARVEDASATEQAEIINNALSMLSGLVPALAPAMTPSPDHSQADLRQWARAARKHVLVLQQFVKSLQGSIREH